MTSHAVRMQERWKDGSTLDIHKEMMHVTSEIISKAVLGSDIKAEEDEVGVALQTCMEYFNRLQMPFGELIEKIPILHINKGYQSAKKKLDSIVYSMIKEHRDNETKGVYHKEDLLYTLLQAQDTEAGIGRMTDLQLKDEVMTIFLAGHETTSNALTWTFYLLSQHPTADDRLYAELCSVLGDEDAKRIPTVEDIPKLEYAEKVFRESMRLYPPAWTLGRKAINDYKVDKYVIPAGSIIQVNTSCIMILAIFLTRIPFIQIVGPKKQGYIFLDLAISHLAEVLEAAWVSHLHGWKEYCY
jgi:cytochrome P450